METLRVGEVIMLDHRARGLYPFDVIDRSGVISWGCFRNAARELAASGRHTARVWSVTADPVYFFSDRSL